jgi:hypothetical protein
MSRPLTRLLLLLLILVQPLTLLLLLLLLLVRPLSFTVAVDHWVDLTLTMSLTTRE